MTTAPRAMWKGALRIASTPVPVKLYSAVQDHDIHFRLLHKKDLTPVSQALVHPETDTIVPFEETQRGYTTAEGEIVVLRPEELDALEPKESRDIEFSRFVPEGAIDPQWYDRPYYLAPDGAPEPYFALTAALARTGVEGVARWVMRKKEYAGALRVHDGLLMLVTLRRAGEVVAIDSLEAPTGPSLDEKELAMARQLMEMLHADFDPTEYRDEYRDRVMDLIESKRRGEKPKLRIVRPKAASGDLADLLAASLRSAAKEKKRATA